MALKITLAHENGTDKAECSTFLQANSVLARWAWLSADRQGYYKIRFELRDAERDLSYDGRYDLVHVGQAAPDLGQHVTDHLLFIAGERKPSSLEQAQYETFLARCWPAEMRERAAHLARVVSDIVLAEYQDFALEDEETSDAESPAPM